MKLEGTPSMDNLTLPSGFEGLQPFVAQWAATTTSGRDRCRGTSSPAEREAFFQSAKELIEPALSLLDQKSFDRMSEQEQRLMNLVLGFAHVAMAVEIHGDKEAGHARLRAHMRITQSPADQ
jgi:hypothetical protein